MLCFARGARSARFIYTIVWHSGLLNKTTIPWRNLMENPTNGITKNFQYLPVDIAVKMYS